MMLGAFALATKSTTGSIARVVEKAEIGKTGAAVDHVAQDMGAAGFRDAAEVAAKKPNGNL
jgi:hypothetical protein